MRGSDVVAGELLYGFRNGTQYPENRRELDAFLTNRFVALLPVTVVTAHRFGLVAAALRRTATPIPSNDIWIAAHALETGADLIGFDDHFSHVDGLAFLHLREL